jgi:hypothetical protein
MYNGITIILLIGVLNLLSFFDLFLMNTKGIALNINNVGTKVKIGVCTYKFRIIFGDNSIEPPIKNIILNTKNPIFTTI